MSHLRPSLPRLPVSRRLLALSLLAPAPPLRSSRRASPPAPSTPAASARPVSSRADP